MKIRVTIAFNDRQNGYVTRPVNEVFENVPSREQRNSLTAIYLTLFFGKYISVYEPTSI